MIRQVICFLLVSINFAFSAPVRVQGNLHSNGAGASTTVAVTLGATVGSAHMLAVCVAWGNSLVSDVVNSITDDKSNTYTIVDTVRDATNSETFVSAYAFNITNAPITITATLNASRNFNGILVDEFSGILTTNPIDGHAMQVQAAPGTGANAITSGNFTTASNGDLIYGCNVDTAGPGDANSGTGFTQDLFLSNGFVTEHKVQSSAGSVAATFTATTGTDGFITGGMGFKPTVTTTTGILLLAK